MRGSRSTRVLLALTLALLLWGCALRRYNSSSSSVSSSSPSDPGGYYAVPGAVRSSDGFVGFLIVTQPIMTHAAFVESEALILANLPGWRVRPWGSGRFVNLVYVPKDHPDRLEGVDGPVTARQILGWGRRLLVSVDPVTLEDLEIRRTVWDAKQPHHKNESITVADLVEPPRPGPASGAPVFRDQVQEPLETTDPEWSLKFGRVPLAWQFLKQKFQINASAPPLAFEGTDVNLMEMGRGIRIGVVDTGFLPDHHEFERSNAINRNVRMDEGRNVVEGEDSSSPLDRFVIKGRSTNPGHGTAVIGVLNATLPFQGARPWAYAAGLVPGAEVIPMRATSSSIYKDPRALARAVHDLIDKKVQIISISLGGLPEMSLEQALERAHKAGIIVVAAAGNGTRFKVGEFLFGGFAVFPAVWPSVIAVGAGNVSCRAWRDSAPAIEVDVLAPGEDVWSASTYRSANGEMIESLRRGSGTSFATPYVAAAAALWIQSNGGIENLKRIYGGASPQEAKDWSLIPRAFEVALKRYGLKLPMSHPRYNETAAKQSYCTGYDPKLVNKTGAGFVDVLNLVKAPLPSPAEVREHYVPAVSRHGEIVLKHYKDLERIFFRVYDWAAGKDALVGLASQVKEAFGTTPENTRWFVLSVLHHKYFGAGTRAQEGRPQEASEGPLNQVRTAGLELVKLKPSCVDFVKAGRAEGAAHDGASAMTCELGFLGLFHDYPQIDTEDAAYVLKAFEYLAEGKAKRGLGPVTEQDKRDMLEDLLEGREDWMPE